MALTDSHDRLAENAAYVRKRLAAARKAAKKREQEAREEALKRIAAEKRLRESRTVAASSKRKPKRRPLEQRVHGRDAIENVRSYGSPKRGRPAHTIENLRARTTSNERRTLTREQASKPPPRASGRTKVQSLGPSGLGGISRAALGDLKDIGYGVADFAADYGTALAKDLDPRDFGIPFRRTGKVLARDALGLLATAETAIPEPKWVPAWMRREILEVDPERLSIRRGSGKIDPDDSRRAEQFWRENPLLGALLLTPAGGRFARNLSRGRIAADIRRANPELSPRQARRVAKRESRMPGYAAAHEIAGGIEPRVLTGKLPAQVVRAQAATPRLRRLVDVAVRGTGARAVHAPPKGATRAQEKVFLEKFGDPDVRDLARSTIVVETPEQLAAVLARLKRVGKVVGAANAFGSAAPLGYRHGKVWLDVDGHVSEVQLVTPEMLAAKEARGHALYERYRALPEGAKKDRLRAESEALYAAAESSFAQRLASSQKRSAETRGQRSSSVSGGQGISVPPGLANDQARRAVQSTTIGSSGQPKIVGAAKKSSLSESRAGLTGSENLERIFSTIFPKPSVPRQAGVVVGRPWSRHPIGRAGQRAYDRASAFVETRFGPGARFSTSQRAARAKERELRKRAARVENEVVRLEREMRKGIGALGRSQSGREALIAVLEAPKELTPRQAVELKLADLRSTIERPRTPEEARARIEALDREITKGLRPLVDEAFPVAARRREQAMRNVVEHTRGKRARRALETELELTGIRGSRKGGGSVLADAQARIESQIVRMAAKPDADPTVRRVAQMVVERDVLRERMNDPDVVFGSKPVELGLTGADPASARRLQAQVALLERALEGGKLDSPEFARAVAAAEKLSAQAEDVARVVLGLSDSELAARRNLVASRYAAKGLLPEGVEPQARGFFPHRDLYESLGSGRIAAPTLAASGQVVGTPRKGRAFESRRNELRLYEQGRVSTEPRVLSNLVRQRTRYLLTHEGRRYLYEQGQPIRKGEPIPEGVFLVRDPDLAPEKIPPSVRLAIENPERYLELAAREGGFPEGKTFETWLDTWLYRGTGPEPEWVTAMQGVRAVPEGVVKTVLSDVFASAPRGSLAAVAGALNAAARATTIYLPYGGVRYVARNTAQNMILLALTKPQGFLELRKAVDTVRRREPEVWAAIKAETGSVPAAAGLPDLFGSRRSAAQRFEASLTQGSRAVAGKLGDLGDEPWRVASWLSYAKAYGYGTREGRRRLLSSDDPAIKRVRDDIAQRVREDMLDFDALTPAEREKLTRVFFIWAFKRAALKWPFVYLREYPERAAILSLVAAQHEREETPGRKTSVLESGRTEIGGREIDLGWLFPQQPAAETIEDAADLAAGIDRDRVNLRPLVRQLAPQYRFGVEAGSYGGAPTERLARTFVPFWTTAERIGKGGSLGEQVLRGLGSTVEYVEKIDDPAERLRERLRLERQEVTAALRSSGLLARYPTLARRLRDAYERKLEVDLARAKARQKHPRGGEDYQREALRRELALLRRWGGIAPAIYRKGRAVADRGSVVEVEEWRRVVSSDGFEPAFGGLIREARKAAGGES